jgi:nicotinamide phosphoribosyltransferase
MASPLENIDFYKVSHKNMYPKGTEYVYSNLTPRSSKYFGGSSLFDNKVVNIGYQGFIKDWLIDDWNNNFFKRPKHEVVSEYRRRLATSLGPNAASDLKHIEDLHDLGYLPLLIKTLPEGVRSNIGVPVMTIVNTDPRFFWLTNYIETHLSAYLWHMLVNATTAYEYRRVFEKYYDETGSNKFLIQFAGHDFAYRGLDAESVGRTQFPHLLPFVGTDTVPAIAYAEKFYNANAENELIGCSVPATEHSVMTAYGQEDEQELFRHIIQDLYPSGIVSIVSDSFDYWKVLAEYAPKLKSIIENRTPDANGNAKVVFRPDSGDPVKIICGYKVWDADAKEICSFDFNGGGYDAILKDGKYYTADVTYWPDGSIDIIESDKELSEEEVKGSIQVLWDTFGGTVNSAGFKELNPRVGLIYGDSITIKRAIDIFEQLKAKGFAASNVVFGIGSYTYQMVSRDTIGLAVKATWVQIDGTPKEIFKDPKTDDGTKKSAKGLLAVFKQGEDYVLKDRCTSDEETLGELTPIFQDGVLLRETSLSEIRSRLLQ